MSKHALVKIKSNGKYWQAFWVDERTGKRKTRSLGAKSKFKTKRELEGKRRELEDRVLADGAAGHEHSFTIRAWHKAYEQSRFPHLSERTRRNQRPTMAYIEEYFEREMLIEEITRHAAASWRDWLGADPEAECNPGKGLGVATLAKHSSIAKVIYGHAFDRDLLKLNPFDRLVSTTPAPDASWRVLTDDEEDRLIYEATLPVWRPIVALCALAGLRAGEALALRWDDVLWDRDRLRVVNETGRKSTKKRTREVLMVPRLQRVLLDAREAQLPAECQPYTDRVVPKRISEGRRRPTTWPAMPDV